MHPVVEGHWPVSSLRCEIVVMCVCWCTQYIAVHTLLFFKQPTRNAESIVGQVYICGTPDQESRLQLLYSPGRLLWRSGLPQCSVDVEVLASGILPCLRCCRMNSVFPMSSCSPSVFNINCSPGCTMGSYRGFHSSFHCWLTLLCRQHRPIPSVKCLYLLSIRLLDFLTDFLVSFLL